VAELNSTIVSWLDAGKLREALVGEGEFFLMDHTNRDSHDIMCVCYVLIRWASQSEKLQAIAQEFERILLELCVSDPEKVLDILLAYTIAARDARTALPCDVRPAFDTACRALSEGSARAADCDAAAWGRRISELRKRL